MAHGTALAQEKGGGVYFKAPFHNGIWSLKPHKERKKNCHYTQPHYFALFESDARLSHFSRCKTKQEDDMCYRPGGWGARGMEGAEGQRGCLR